MKYIKLLFILIPIISFTILMLLIPFIFKNIFFSQWDFGTVPDWISSVCNIIMAGAALYAAYLAKNWLNPNLMQQGLPKVISFLQKEYTNILNPKLHSVNVSLISNAMAQLGGAIKNTSQYQKNETFINVRSELINSMPTTLHPIINHKDLDVIIGEFKWYGFHLKKENIDILKEIIIKVSMWNSFHKNLIDELESGLSDSFKSRYIKWTEFDEITMGKRSEKIITIASDYSSKLDVIKLEINELTSKLKIKSPVVTDLFDIVK